MLQRLLPLAIGASLLLIPTPEAEACSPPFPSVTASTPQEGQSWPANAAVLFEGYSLYSDGFSASVAGQPAEVIMIEGLRGRSNGQSGGFGPEQVGFTMNPAPNPGERVEVRWAECPDCEGFTLQYTAGPEEALPRPAAPSIAFDLAYYDDIEISGNLCFYFEALAYAWHLDLQGEGPGGYPIALEIKPRTLGGDALYKQILFTAGEGVETVYYGDSSDVAGTPAAESICFDVTARDLFGQVSERVSSCMPCNIATPVLTSGTETGSGSVIYDNFPPEPAWDLEGAPSWGGLCDTGPECEEEGEGGDGGCSSAPTSEMPLWSLVFLGALGLRFRRTRSS